MKSKVDMSVELPGVGGGSSLRLKNPVIAASGTFGYGAEFKDLMDLDQIGGLVTKGVSLKPRQGNPPPRICETAGGMLNAIGIANVGLEAFLSDKLPFLEKLNSVVAVNLYGHSEEEFVSLARRLSGGPAVAALELNVSCPNVREGGLAFGQDAKAVARVTKAVRAVTSLPVWVKLTPNVADPRPMARAAADAGADAVSLINTLMGMAIDARAERPRIANCYAGLSGPAIKPVGLRMVHQIARDMPGFPIIGLGGIMTGEDAAEFMLAGAWAVQVGTANFNDPLSCLRIAGELGDFCKEQGIKRVRDLTGALKD